MTNFAEKMKLARAAKAAEKLGGSPAAAAPEAPEAAAPKGKRKGVEPAPAEVREALADATVSDAAAETTETTETVVGQTTYENIIATIRKTAPDFADWLPKESPQVYLKRVLLAVGRTIPEEDFEAMDEAAQVWYEASAKLNKAGRPIAAPEGLNLDRNGERVNVAGKGGVAAKTSAAPKPAKPAKAAPAPKEPKAEGVVARLRRAVVLDHTITLEGLMNFAKAQGFPDIKVSTASVVRTDTLGVIKLAKEAGLWKD